MERRAGQQDSGRRAAWDSYLVGAYPERVIDGQQAHNDYVEMSGTSMSAAVVSGAAALLLEASPAMPRK